MRIFAMIKAGAGHRKAAAEQSVQRVRGRTIADYVQSGIGKLNRAR